MTDNLKIPRTRQGALERNLQNILAIIHRDGGHYTAGHGIKKSTEDAIKIVYQYQDGKPVRNECLAHLIWLYERDEPYDEGEKVPFEPVEETLWQFRNDLERAHDGDCTREPHPCLRCHAEWATRKATWILERQESVDEESMMLRCSPLSSQDCEKSSLPNLLGLNILRPSARSRGRRLMTEPFDAYAEAHKALDGVVHLPGLSSLLKEVYERGRNDGLEEAAEICDESADECNSIASMCHLTDAAKIRALKREQP